MVQSQGGYNETERTYIIIALWIMQSCLSQFLASSIVSHLNLHLFKTAAPFALL